VLRHKLIHIFLFKLGKEVYVGTLSKCQEKIIQKAEPLSHVSLQTALIPITLTHVSFPNFSLDERCPIWESKTKFQKKASFTLSERISAGREAPDVASFDECIASCTMDEKKDMADGRFAAGRKLTEKVKEAQKKGAAITIDF
jgi:hypothetical protein